MDIPSTELEVQSFFIRQNNYALLHRTCYDGIWIPMVRSTNNHTQWVNESVHGNFEEVKQSRNCNLKFKLGLTTCAVFVKFDQLFVSICQGQY